MVEYNIVKFCGLCRERFVVKKAEARRYFCDKCQAKVNKERKAEQKENAQK